MGHGLRDAVRPTLDPCIMDMVVVVFAPIRHIDITFYIVGMPAINLHQKAFGGFDDVMVQLDKIVTAIRCMKHFNVFQQPSTVQRGPAAIYIFDARKISFVYVR